MLEIADVTGGNEGYREVDTRSNRRDRAIAALSSRRSRANMGWYGLNYNEFPVIVTRIITGYYDDIVNYEIF